MDVGHIILGKLWLHDLDVTVLGCSNSCLFVHNGKKVKLATIWPTPLPETKWTDASSNKKALSLISAKALDTKIAKGSMIVVLIVREIIDDF